MRLHSVILYLSLFCAAICSAQHSPAPLKLVDIILSPNSSNWTYETGEQAEVDIAVLKYGVPIKDVTVKFEYGPEMMKADEKGLLKLKNGKGKINIGTSREPGFRVLKVQVMHDGKSYKNQAKVGYSPDKITPTVKMPKDFDAYWEKALADNARIPMDAQVKFLPEFSDNEVDVFLVGVQNYKKSKRIYGYLCKPKKAGKYPVLYSPPGAGVKKISPYTGYAKKGYISFCIEIHGITPELSKNQYKEVSRAIGDYAYINLDDKDNYYYKSVYLGCIRAIDYLCSLPEWDGKNVVVTGGSQGGALTMVAAGLDKRVTALAAFYPALCDMEGYLHGRAGGWPHLFKPSRQDKTSTPKKIETASYYDVVNFAKRIKAPGFYSFGYNDNVCPPTSTFSAYNSVEAPKELVVTPISGHWRFGESMDKAMKFLKGHLEE